MIEVSTVSTAIVELLKSSKGGAQLSVGDRWLVWDDDNEWCVWQHLYRQRGSDLIWQGADEYEAVVWLTGELH